MFTTSGIFGSDAYVIFDIWEMTFIYTFVTNCMALMSTFATRMTKIQFSSGKECIQGMNKS